MTEKEKNDEAFFHAIVVAMFAVILAGGELLRLITSADHFWIGIQLATGAFIAVWYFYQTGKSHPRVALAYTALVLVHFGLVNGKPQPQLLLVWGIVLGVVWLGSMLFAFAMYVASTRQPRDLSCSLAEIKQAASR